jgi:DNA-binding transcriptional LysR family regulator
MLAVRSDHPLADTGELRLEQAAGIPLALPDFDFGVRQIIDAATGRLGVRLEPILTSNDFEVLRSFVRAGAGAALLPMRAILRHGEGARLIAVPVKEPSFETATIDLIVLRKRRLPRVLQAFVEELRGQLASIGPSKDSRSTASASPS